MGSWKRAEQIAAQQTAAAILVSRELMAFSAAAASGTPISGHWRPPAQRATDELLRADRRLPGGASPLQGGARPLRPAADRLPCGARTLLGTDEFLHRQHARLSAQRDIVNAPDAELTDDCA